MVTTRLVITPAGPVQVLPPLPPSMLARILAFFHLGGSMAAQPPANVSAKFDKATYNPGDTMTIVVTAQSVNQALVPFTVPVTVEDASVSPPQQVTVETVASVSAPNPLTASEGDTSGRTWQQGSAAMTAGGAFSTSFTATA